MYPKWLSIPSQCYAALLSWSVAKTLKGGLLVVAFSLGCSTLAYAQSANSNTSTTTNAEPEVNQQQAIAKAKQSVQGKVLKVDRNKEHYRVKMLNQKGRVISVNVNKQSGKVMPKTSEKIQPKKDKD
ncbi:MAG: PepSY domain-containing protein [Glaciecola sp.]|nr:PepSY domain-containing protein [Glaciecola sp.]MDG1922035.1 PepSY domain-containing protein [Glaciecola sp.]